MKRGTAGAAEIELGGAHQRDAQRAEGVAERGPLWNGGHVDEAQRHADEGSQHQADGNPPVVDDAAVEQRSADRQRHAHLAGQDAAAGRGRRAQPFQREDEKRRRDEIGDLDRMVRRERQGSWLRRLAGLEHPQHAIGHQEAAHDVAGRGDDGHRRRARS